MSAGPVLPVERDLRQAAQTAHSTTRRQCSTEIESMRSAATATSSSTTSTTTTGASQPVLPTVTAVLRRRRRLTIRLRRSSCSWRLRRSNKLRRQLRPRLHNRLPATSCPRRLRWLWRRPVRRLSMLTDQLSSHHQQQQQHRMQLAKNIFLTFKQSNSHSTDNEHCFQHFLQELKAKTHHKTQLTLPHQHLQFAVTKNYSKTLKSTILIRKNFTYSP